MPGHQLEKSFQKQMEILRKKLEEISPLHEAPYDPETGRSKTCEVKVLRNNLMQIVSNYVVIMYTEVTEIFEKKELSKRNRPGDGICPRRDGFEGTGRNRIPWSAP